MVLYANLSRDVKINLTRILTGKSVSLEIEFIRFTICTFRVSHHIPYLTAKYKKKTPLMRYLQFEFKIVVHLRSLMPYLTSSADPDFHGKK